MNCKFCNAELEEGISLCPACGQENAAEPEVPEELTETEQIEELPAEETEELPAEAAEEMAEEVSEEASEEVPAKKSGNWKLVALIAGGVLLLAIAVCLVLYFCFDVNFGIRPNDIACRESYTVEDDQADKKSGKVVATIDDEKLTNAELQIYYWNQVYDFLNNYGVYYFDYTQPLHQQVYNTTTGQTWEQYFLEIALQTWQRYETLCVLAEENGYELNETQKEALASIPDDLEKQAEASGYASVDEMLATEIAPGCDLEAYMEYLKSYYIGVEYFNQEYENMTPTQDEIEAYYTENEASFQMSGITKDSGLQSDVRHILVMPKGGTEDENGVVTYSEAEWEACLKEAEGILEQWKNGEATEESFAELANTYSEDGGSNTTGGLYQGITATSSYVEPFRSWAVDSARKIGDTGIVETTFGYHIMYFVGGEEAWIAAARNNLIAETASNRLTEAVEQWPMEVNYKKIALGYVKLG